MTKDLRTFLRTVEEAGPRFFQRVKKPVKPDFDVSVIQQKLTKIGQFPVLYFPEVIGSRLPMVSNLFGSYENLGLALDLTPKKMAEAGKGHVMAEYLKRKAKGGTCQDVSPSESPVREVVLKDGEVDLGVLPIGRHAEFNGGDYITIGATVLVDPDTGLANAGIYRQMVIGKNRTACNITPHHHGTRIIRRYQKLGKLAPVVTFLGHHPAVLMGAGYGGPLSMSELEFMSALLNEPLETTKAVTVNVPVPARAEIAIEGIIDPEERVRDGPFSEGSGYYDEGNGCYVIKVTAITMRHDAIYHELCPMHHEHMSVNRVGRESLIYEQVRKAVPGLRSVHLGPESAMSSGICFIAIKKSADDDGHQAGMVAIQQARSPRLIVVVDEDVDIFDQSEVLWAVCTRMQKSAVSIHSSARSPIVLIDATKPLGKPFLRRALPPQSRWGKVQLTDYL